MRVFIVIWVGAVMSIVSFSRASAGSIVNGGFDTGDFTGWTLVGDPETTFVGTGFVHNGKYSAFLGEAGDLGSLSQTLTTSVGTSYSLSFWFAGDGETPSEFTSTIGGRLLLDLVNPPFDVDYREYIYGFTAASTATVLSFEFRDDAFFMNLDDVSVVVVSSVPEPASVLRFITGLVGVACLIWYRHRRPQPKGLERNKCYDLAFRFAALGLMV